MPISSRASRFVGWSKPVPATRRKKPTALTFAEQRLLWLPLIERVAKTGVPLKSFSKSPLPPQVRAEILRNGMDTWLGQVCPETGRIWPNKRIKRK